MMFGQYGWKDCLAGLEITLPRNPAVATVVYEYVGTKDQSGPIFHDATSAFPYQISAIDDYYNHSIYTGWQHWGQGIGNPLLIAPAYNTDGLIIFKSNRIKAHHIALAGTPSKEWHYRVLFSYARHWGTYFDPFPEVKKSINTLLEASYQPQKLNRWTFILSFAADGGQLIGRNIGAMLCIRKSGLLKKQK